MLTKKKQARASVLTALLLSLLVQAGCSPTGPEALRDGKRSLDRGQPLAAVRRLQDAVSLMPANALAWGYLGLAYHQSGNASNAAAAYRQALSHGPNLAEVRFSLGCLLMEQEQWADAREQFAAATVLDKNAAQNWRWLGEADVRLGESAQAVRNLGESLRLKSDNADAWNWLGIAQFQFGRIQEADRSFRSALRVQANHGPAILNLAILNQEKLKNPERALELYRQYIAFFPSASNVAEIRSLSQVLEEAMQTQIKSPDADQIAARVPDRKAASAPTNQVASKIVIQTNLVTQTTPDQPRSPSSKPITIPKDPASEPRPESVAVPPSSPIVPQSNVSRTEQSSVTPTTSKLANAEQDRVADREDLAATTAPKQKGFFAKINPLKLFKKGDSEKKPTPLPEPSTSVATGSDQSNGQGGDVNRPAAKNVPKRVEVANMERFRRYVYPVKRPPPEGDRISAERVYAEAETLRRRGLKQEAIDAYIKVLDFDPSLFPAQFNLGLLSLETGNLQSALAAFETATVLQPGSVPARYNLALALKSANYPIDSANELLVLLNQDPDDARAHLTLGNLFAQQLGDKAQAREHYARVLELAPGHPQASAIGFWLVENPM